MQELIAGGAAGAIAKTCVAPLERVKILFQTGRMKTATASGGSKSSSISGTLASIARTEGLRGLFKGNGASVLRIVPYSALHFGAYEQYREWLVRALKLDGGEEAGDRSGGGGENPTQAPGRKKEKAKTKTRVPPWVDLLAGSGAGATAVLATYPLDLARTRLAYDMEGGVAEAEAAKARATAGPSNSAPEQEKKKRTVSPSKPATVRSVLRATVAQHGLRGLYCGIGPTLAGILPYAGLKFYVYQSAKHAHSSNAAAASSDDGGRGGGGGGGGGGQGGEGKEGEGKEGEGPGERGSSSSSPRRPSVAVTLAFGAAAGLVAQTATYPLDVVRRQMQVAGLAQAQAARVGGNVGSGGGGGAAGVGGATAKASSVPSPTTTTTTPATAAAHAMPRSTWAGLRSVWASGGLRAAFAGVSINYLKVVPSTAIGFSTYDFLKSYLGLSHNL